MGLREFIFVRGESSDPPNTLTSHMTNHEICFVLIRATSWIFDLAAASFKFLILR